MKKGWVIAGVVALVLVVLLGGLAAAWYWAGPWLAQEYIDWQHPGWDVIHVQRYDEMGAIVFIVLIPDEFAGEETVAVLTTIGKVARILRMPDHTKIGILFVRELRGIYFMQVEVVAPMDKTEWIGAEDCTVTPLYFFGATLKSEYITWPD